MYIVVDGVGEIAVNDGKRRAAKALRQVALLEGVPVGEVYREIERAMEAAMRNPDPGVQRFWRMLTGSKIKPSPEDFVFFATEYLLNRRLH